MDDDPFRLLHKEYDPFDIVTTATNKYGIGSEVRVRIPPHLMDQLTALIHSGSIPAYKRPADFARDAIYHRLHFWDSYRDDLDLTEAIDEYKMLASVASASEQLEQAEQVLQQLKNLERAKPKDEFEAEVRNLLAVSRNKFLRDKIKAEFRL